MIEFESLQALNTFIYAVTAFALFGLIGLWLQARSDRS